MEIERLRIHNGHAVNDLDRAAPGQRRGWNSALEQLGQQPEVRMHGQWGQKDESQPGTTDTRKTIRRFVAGVRWGP